ncbi:MAG: hypothetical protein JSR28_14135 [Proteobacteria bacterium]|nr:hypothetical protein [Pseudomonadota bacterium]
MIRQSVFLGALALSAPAWAINKCTGADGKVVYQDAMCGTSSATSEQIKTWTNSGYAGDRTPASKAVEPNTQLEGPAEAAPLLDMYRRWADAERLALATGRIALAGPAATLQALLREVQAMKPPACLKLAHMTLQTLVGKSVETILRFMGKDELTGMLYQYAERPKLIPQFEREVKNARCE